MRTTAQESGEWVGGFLFVGNRPILDFLNTRLVLSQVPTELLTDFDALERWFIASGIVNSLKTRRRLRSWHNLPEAAVFLKELLAFRERLRDAVLRIEAGKNPPGEFVKEVNARLLDHPPRTALRERNGQISRETVFEPQTLADLWAPFVDGAADLLTESGTRRIRQCESCVVHFYDTSKKGSRRWCSMNICGNKIKVAAYQRRKRYGNEVRRHSA
ncbi:MAG TPA: ABATE domain-containing protein [Terracidiphilus sp.]